MLDDRWILSRKVASFSSSAHAPAALAALLALIAFAFYVYLIEQNPNVYWFDPITRLAHLDQVSIGRWLPGLQVILIGIDKVAAGLPAIRILLASIGPLAALALYALGSRLFTPLVGLVALILLSTNVMFVSLTIVPYAEVLFIALVLAALVLLDEPRTQPRLYAGALLVAAACLTRYEGWILVGVLIVQSLGSFRRSPALLPRTFMPATLLMTSPILGWLLFGSLTIESYETDFAQRVNAHHWIGFLETFANLLSWQVGLLLLGFGTLGWLRSRTTQTGRRIHNTILIFLACDLVLIGVVEPYSGGNLRPTFILLVFLHLYAAYGIVQLAEWGIGWVMSSSMSKLKGRLVVGSALLVAITISLHSARSTESFVARASREPAYDAAQIAGRWLTTQPTDDAGVLALTDHSIQPLAIAAQARLLPSRVLSLEASGAGEVAHELEGKRLAYVLDVHANDSGLGGVELEILESLQMRQGPADSLRLGPATAWVLPADELRRLLD